LLLAGAKPDDERVQAAVAWLAERDKLDEVPGFEDLKQDTGWQKGLLYYYYARLSSVLPLLPEETGAKRRGGILAQLIERQGKDGSWQNESARMREDDPLIATSLAVVALSQALAGGK
jgi:hypothetical protein